MTMLESIRIAARALRANLLRSALTMLGIVIGVAAVVTMAAVGAGAQARIIEQIRSLGANLLMVSPEAVDRDGTRLAGGARPSLRSSDASAIAEAVPRVQASAPSVRGQARIIHGNRNWSTVVNGTSADYFVAREWPLASGRYFSDEETRGAAKVAIVGRTVASELFAGAPAPGATIRIGTTPFEVIGVLSGKGPSGSGRDQDDIVFVPLDTARMRLFGSAHAVDPDAVEYILVKVVTVDDMETVATSIRELLRGRHGLGPGQPDDFRIADPAAAMSAQRETARTVAWLLAAIASVSLAVGGISIMNIMLVSVTERTREIGLRLAVGARRRDVRDQFLIEAVALCLAGGALGVAAGIGAAVVTARLTGWAVLVTPESVLLAVGFAGLVGVLFGCYPAARASRLDPIEALRFE